MTFSYRYVVILLNIVFFALKGNETRFFDFTGIDGEVVDLNDAIQRHLNGNELFGGCTAVRMYAGYIHPCRAAIMLDLNNGSILEFTISDKRFSIRGFTRNTPIVGDHVGNGTQTVDLIFDEFGRLITFNRTEPIGHVSGEVLKMVQAVSAFMDSGELYKSYLSQFPMAQNDLCIFGPSLGFRQTLEHVEALMTI